VSGLLIAGRALPVDGLEIVNSNDAAWCRLSPEDYRMRRTTWPRAIVVHSTGGNWPQTVRLGAGRRGHAAQIADMWSGRDRGGGERTCSGSHLIVDFDGLTACLADLQYVTSYHATSVNDVTIGIEMCTLPDASIYQATIDATVALCRAICDAMGIPFQINSSHYTGHPIPRLANGGADAVGIYGHRDQSEQRGRGDPGDAVYSALIAAGAEPLDFATGQDLDLGRARQQRLNAGGASLTVDGLVGPASVAAARAQGYGRWRDIPAN